MSKLKTSLTAVVGSDPLNEPVAMESVDGYNDRGEFAKKFLPTLPPVFKSVFGKSMNIKDVKPRQLIESLGEILGVTDYSTNMPSFWFLDTLAVRVLKHSKDLDEYNTSVLVNWLTGEIKMLRDRQYIREEFFTEMKIIFTEAASKVLERHRLLYWDEIMCANAEEEWEGLFVTMQSQDSLPKPSPSQETVKSNGIDPISMLNIVIECTYDMYANELRYALVYTVFVEPVQVRIYELPFTFRTPRQIKLAHPKTPPFGTKLQKNLKKVDGTEKSKKSTERTKGKEKLKPSIGIPDTPPGSLDDEKLLMYKRMFILPLIESHEATEMFETRTNYT